MRKQYRPGKYHGIFLNFLAPIKTEMLWEEGLCEEEDSSVDFFFLALILATKAKAACCVSLASFSSAVGVGGDALCLVSM